MNQIASGIFNSKILAEEFLETLKEKGIAGASLIVWNGNHSFSRPQGCENREWPGAIWSSQLSNLGATAGSFAGSFLGLALGISLWPWTNSIPNMTRQGSGPVGWSGAQACQTMNTVAEPISYSSSYQVWICGENAAEAAKLLKNWGAKDVRVGSQQN